MITSLDHVIYNRGSPNNVSALGIKDLVNKSQSVLFKASSVFLLDLFPDTILVDENKVSIVFRSFVTQRVHSILIEDITDITVDTNPFFATLYITDSNNPRFPNTYKISNLKKSDAICACRLIQGMVACRRSGIEIKGINCKILAEQIESLGEAKEIE